MVDHPHWPLICLRHIYEEKDVKDGKLCTSDSYMNATITVKKKLAEQGIENPTQE